MSERAAGGVWQGQEWQPGSTDCIEEAGSDVTFQCFCLRKNGRRRRRRFFSDWIFFFTGNKMSNLWRSWWIFPCLDDELRHWHVDSASIPQCTLWIRARLVSSSSWSLLSACLLFPFFLGKSLLLPISQFLLRALQSACQILCILLKAENDLSEKILLLHGLFCLLVCCFLSSWENPFCFQFPSSFWELDNLLVRFFVFYWKLRITWVRIQLQFNLFKSGQSKDLITIQSMWEWPEQGSDCNLLYVRMARARIWLWFNLFVAHHFGAVFENPNKEFCGWGVQSSRDWRTKWRGCKVQSRIKH